MPAFQKASVVFAPRAHGQTFSNVCAQASFKSHGGVYSILCITHHNVTFLEYPMLHMELNVFLRKGVCRLIIVSKAEPCTALAGRDSVALGRMAMPMSAPPSPPPPLIFYNSTCKLVHAGHTNP